MLAQRGARSERLSGAHPEKDHHDGRYDILKFQCRLRSDPRPSDPSRTPFAREQ
jgi:hypothetical protein